MTLGYDHPDQLPHSREQLQDWWAYYQSEPWGEVREDARTMWLVAMVISAFGGEVLRSAVHVPWYINEIYGPPGMSEEMAEQLEQIRKQNRGNRLHNSDQARRPNGESEKGL